MRVFRLAALISIAQIGVVMILFSFAFVLFTGHAHAATIYSQLTDYGSANPQWSIDPQGNGGITHARLYVQTATSSPVFMGMYGVGAFQSSAGTLPSSEYFSDQCYSGSDSIGAYYDCNFPITYNITDYTQGNTSSNFLYVELAVPFCGNTSCWGTRTGMFNLSSGVSNGVNGTSYNWYGYINGTAYTPPPADVSTHITPLTPNPVGQISTTTSTTSVTFSANYLYNTDLVGDPLTAINLRLAGLNQASTSQYTLTPLVSYPSTAAEQTVSYTLTLPSGSEWQYSWDFDATAPWGSISEFGTPTQQIFVVTNPIAVGLATTTNNIGGTYTPASCDVTDLTGCVQNAIAFLFWPDPIAFEQFSTVTGNVRTHAPFGYVYIMLGQVGQISGSTTPTFSLAIDSTIQTAYFDPIKNGLATVLWALAAMWFLNRLRKLDL